MVRKFKEEASRNPVQTWGVLVACVISLGAPLGVMQRVGAWQAQIESRVAFNEQGDVEHHHDRSLHMPYEQKVESFVTRREFNNLQNDSEKQREEMKASILRIEEKAEKIYEILRQK